MANSSMEWNPFQCPACGRTGGHDFGCRFRDYDLPKQLGSGKPKRTIVWSEYEVIWKRKD